MAKKNTAGLQKYTKAKNAETIEKVNAAIDKLKRSKTAQPSLFVITFPTCLLAELKTVNPAPLLPCTPRPPDF